MIQQLTQIGLTEYEAKVYKALLEYGAMGGGQVSKKSTVPHGKTYVALGSLEDKGFVSVTPTKPKKFSPINPTIAIPHFAAEKIRKLQRIEKAALESTKKLKQKKIFPEIEDTVAVLKGKKQAKAILVHGFKSAKKYVKETRTMEYIPALVKEREKEMQKRNIQHKIIATKKGPQELLLMKEYVNLGIEVRFYPLHHLRVHIVDGILIQQHLVNPANIDDRMVLYAENKEYAQAMEAFFDSIWKKAKKITQKTKLDML